MFFFWIVTAYQWASIPYLPLLPAFLSHQWQPFLSQLLHNHHFKIPSINEILWVFSFCAITSLNEWFLVLFCCHWRIDFIPFLCPYSIPLCIYNTCSLSILHSKDVDCFHSQLWRRVMQWTWKCIWQIHSLGKCKVIELSYCVVLGHCCNKIPWSKWQMEACLGLQF